MRGYSNIAKIIVGNFSAIILVYIIYYMDFRAIIGVMTEILRSQKDKTSKCTNFGKNRRVKKPFFNLNSDYFLTYGNCNLQVL